MRISSSDHFDDGKLCPCCMLVWPMLPICYMLRCFRRQKQFRNGAMKQPWIQAKKRQPTACLANVSALLRMIWINPLLGVTSSCFSHFGAWQKKGPSPRLPSGSSAKAFAIPAQILPLPLSVTCTPLGLASLQRLASGHCDGYMNSTLDDRLAALRKVIFSFHHEVPPDPQACLRLVHLVELLCDGDSGSPSGLLQALDNLRQHCIRGTLHPVAAR